MQSNQSIFFWSLEITFNDQLMHKIHILDNVIIANLCPTVTSISINEFVEIARGFSYAYLIRALDFCNVAI